ncbi:MAG: hypothetical protein KGN84_03925 [Acidobacteriota bacterium]|nr:hypothetical protein [Acidobacteriota bacterium]
MKSGHKHLTPITHKDRGQWFYQRSTYPLRDAPPVALEKFWNNPNRFPNIYGLKWSGLGPDNYPGRVTCLVVDPLDSSKLYAGSAAGGVWSSTDGGFFWKPCWPRLLSQHIGSLAMHPHPETFGKKSLLLCASGEANLSADSYSGSGNIFMSSDEGFTWWPAFGDPASPSNIDTFSYTPRRIGSMTFMPDPSEPGLPGFAFGGVSDNETMPAALYLQPAASGVSACTFWGNRNYNCHSVVAHPTKFGLLYAAIEPRGTLNGIWRSEDCGKTWTHLLHGLPRGEDCKRISLAISPSHPSILYALVGSQDGVAHGVFRTSNGGDTWRNTTEFLEGEKQLSYNNCIAVHPKDPDYVLCGALDLHLTRNGGRSWNKVSTGQCGSPPEPFPANHVHFDHHAVVITPDGILYSGNDGGVARSADHGATWQSASEGMTTAMFYAGGVAPADSGIFGGGTQDNGTLIAGVPSSPGGALPAPRHFTRVLPGDGGWIAFAPGDPEHVFGSTSNLIFNRHKRGEPWARGLQLAAWPSVSIDPALFIPGENELRSIAVISIAPKPGHRDENVVFAGTTRLWRTLDDGRHWSPCSPMFDGSAISAIACSPANPETIFVGTSAGSIYRTRDAGKTWTHNIAGPAIPRRVITAIEFHPAHGRSVFVSVAATGIVAVDLNAVGLATTSYGHVYASEDLGDTWTDVDKGALPDIVFNALAFETHPPYRLFAGGDAGVWMLQDNTWASIAGCMPNVVVSALDYHHKDRVLTAATYGRGIWRLKVEGAFPPPLKGSADTSDDKVAPPGFQHDPTQPPPNLLTPTDGAALTTRRAVYSWTPVEGAVGYVVVLSYDLGGIDQFSSMAPDVIYDLNSDGNWTWRVYAIFPGGWRSIASAIRKLSCTTQPDPRPAPPGPPSNPGGR